MPFAASSANTMKSTSSGSAIGSWSRWLLPTKSAGSWTQVVKPAVRNSW